jgi:DNA-binding IclR family transcriptional regulator
MPINPSPAVVRACDVLEHLAAHPTRWFTLSELAREVGVARATCDAVLLALAGRGFVVRSEPDLRYSLGAACITVGDAARAAQSVLAVATPPAEDLARSLRACVALVTRDGDEARVAAMFDHGPPFGVKARVGEAIPLVAPFGAVFAAWDSDRGVQEWLDRADPALAADDRARFIVVLDAVRRRGYSVATIPRLALLEAIERLVDEPGAGDALRQRDEMMREMAHGEYLAADVEPSSRLRVSQMSAPIFDSRGEVRAAIMTLGPDYEIAGSEVLALGERLLTAARKATDQLGGRG